MMLETRWRPPARTAAASAGARRIIDATGIFPSLLTVGLPAAVVELLRPAPRPVPGFSGGM
jgi:hypothetical protein